CMSDRSKRGDYDERTQNREGDIQEPEEQSRDREPTQKVGVGSISPWRQSDTSCKSPRLEIRRALRSKQSYGSTYTPASTAHASCDRKSHRQTSYLWRPGLRLHGRRLWNKKRLAVS